MKYDLSVNVNMFKVQDKICGRGCVYHRGGLLSGPVSPNVDVDRAGHEHQSKGKLCKLLKLQARGP